MFNQKLNHREKLAAARGLARKRFPYFSAALFSLMPRPMAGMFGKVGAAMAVTPRGICYYDPDIVENEWDLEDVEFGMLHEIGHLLRSHSERCEANGFDPKVWNLAGDAAINDDLIAGGCKPLASDMVPSKIVDPKTKRAMKDGLTEEAYYDVLRRQKGDGDGKGKGKGRPGDGQSCGGASGNPLDGLPEDGMHSKAKGGRSNVDIERMKKQVAGDIQEHVKKHGAGSVPGGWAVWSDQLLKPAKIRWQDKVRRAIRNGVSKMKGQVDFHYERPSRRQYAMGYGKGVPILPAMFAPVPRIGCFVDTSGSMGPDDLQLAMSEVSGVLKAAGGDVMFGVCDAQVHGKIETVANVAQACKRLAGGGGTDFRPVFEELSNLNRAKQPHIVIFCTDGDGPAPKLPPPNVTVVWVLVGRHARVPYDDSYEPIKWGEQIFVQDESEVG